MQGLSVSSILQWRYDMSRRKNDKGCLYRHTISPGLTPTRGRSEGQPGAPSPHLVVMPCRRKRSCIKNYISRKAGGGIESMHGLKTMNTIYQPHAKRAR